MRHINRTCFLNELKAILNKPINFSQNGNIYSNPNEEDIFTQVEFIPQSRKYFFTIYINSILDDGITEETHGKIVSYLNSLKLERNIILDTGLFATMI